MKARHQVKGLTSNSTFYDRTIKNGSYDGGRPPKRFRSSLLFRVKIGRTG